MNILCLNTCLKQSYVCLIHDNKIVENVIEDNVQHSITLLKQIDSVFSECNISAQQLDYIAVCVGTGSFTGIRIGLAVAKGIANALNIKIIPIDTLSLIAYNTQNMCQYVVMKGVGNEYFLGNVVDKKVQSMRLTTKDELDSLLTNDTIICSCDNLTNDFNCKIEYIKMPKMNKIVLDNLDKAIDSNEVKPIYLRLSQAELQKGLKNDS